MANIVCLYHHNYKTTIFKFSLIYKPFKTIICIKIFCNMMGFIKINIIKFVIVLYNYINYTKFTKEAESVVIIGFM